MCNWTVGCFYDSILSTLNWVQGGKFLDYLQKEIYGVNLASI